jgi:predicted metallopeptidase
MQTSTAQVRVVRSPNKHARDCARFYVAFNTTQRVNSKNAVYTSGDCIVEDLPKLIAQAVQNLSALDFVIVK